MRYFVDLETTGFSPTRDDILEIAIVDSNGRKFHEFVQPKSIEKEKIVATSKIHGISVDDILDFPPFEEVGRRLLDWLHVRGEWWYHGKRSFDTLFLENFFRYQDRQFDWFSYCSSSDVHSTITIARDRLPGLENYKLNTICNHLGYKFDHHRALSDAFACKYIYDSLIGGEHEQSSAMAGTLFAGH